MGEKSCVIIFEMTKGIIGRIQWWWKNYEWDFSNFWKLQFSDEATNWENTQCNRFWLNAVMWLFCQYHVGDKWMLATIFVTFVHDPRWSDSDHLSPCKIPEIFFRYDNFWDRKLVQLNQSKHLRWINLKIKPRRHAIWYGCIFQNVLERSTSWLV